MDKRCWKVVESILKGKERFWEIVDSCEFTPVRVERCLEELERLGYVVREGDCYNIAKGKEVFVRKILEYLGGRGGEG